MDRMPVLFIGHGSPMNAIEENRFSAAWRELGKQLPKPQAILSVSAHWFTAGTKVSDVIEPRMIYDMYGFPDELYRVKYDAPGSPKFAAVTKELLGDKVQIDNSWGLDHGTWSVLRRLFPNADIPVFQLSVDRRISARDHADIGRALSGLREQGVLIFGSGNVVHNLSMANGAVEGGYLWAEEFDGYIKRNVLGANMDNVIRYEQAGSSAGYAFQTIDHFAPLLYVLGASDEKDTVTVLNEACMFGSLSMTSYLFD
jgi:4,5-DOPA dioxygenase extradiol